MHNDSSRVPLFAYLCLGLSMCMVGSNIGIGKLIVTELPVFLFAAMRFLIASIVLLPGMFRHHFVKAWTGLRGGVYSFSPFLGVSCLAC
ncbi:hypothetical protein [Pseudomonas sp. IC_126]|uniref:hypothetical protein n=1 Tax=Pseudomonas sp. IC_126 TaxID=2547400 RepID=UPI002113CBF3|nr:hypothetical protein [Pseudomonas sp. IC_126]